MVQWRINRASVAEGEEEFQLQHMTPSCPQKPTIPPCLFKWGNFTFSLESFQHLSAASSKSDWAKSHWWSSPERPVCHITMRYLYQPPSLHMWILRRKNDIPSLKKNRRKQGRLIRLSAVDSLGQPLECAGIFPDRGLVDHRWFHPSAGGSGPQKWAPNLAGALVGDALLIKK